MWHCADDATEHRREVEEEHLFELLTRLDPAYDDVRGRLLARDPLPTIREAFAVLRHEESRRKVMMVAESARVSPGSDASALISRGTSSLQKHMGPSPDRQRDVHQRDTAQVHQRDMAQVHQRPFCEHCKKVGHTKSTCWDIYGKPPD